MKVKFTHCRVWINFLLTYYSSTKSNITYCRLWVNFLLTLLFINKIYHR